MAIAIPLTTRPAEAQRLLQPDTTGLELQVGVFTLANQWSWAAGSDASGNTSAATQGAELLMVSRLGGLGLHGRVIRGSALGRQLTVRDAGLLLGSARGALELGYGIRSSLAQDTTVGFAQAGFRINTTAGRSGIRATFAGSGMIPIGKKHQPTSLLRGWQGETALAYGLPRVPVYVQVGWHAYLMDFQAWSEQSTSLRLGAGFWMAGR